MTAALITSISAICIAAPVVLLAVAALIFWSLDERGQGAK